MISNRLKTIASLVNKNAKVLDVGCDHGLLSIYLIESGIASKVIASDVNQNALDNAIKNISKKNLDAKIKTILAFGNNGLTDEIDTIVIAGMGYNTIINIMSLSPSLKNVKNIIIQSNNHTSEVRKYMTTKGYKIGNEKVVYEKDKYYEIILFKKGSKIYSQTSLHYGPYIIKNKDYVDYLRYKQDKLRKVLDSIKTSKNILRKSYIQNEIKKLTRIITKLS